MAIDAKITGITETLPAGEVTLVLGPRDRGTHAGQEKLRVLNPPDNWAKSTLPDLIGCELWGNANELYLGDSRFALRMSYTAVLLCNEWEAVLTRYCESRKSKPTDLQGEPT